MRRILRGALATLAVGLLCVLTLLAWVRTPWGASRLAALAEAWLEERIAGSVHLGEVTFTGPFALRLRHVLLLDDRGHGVIGAGEIFVDVDPLHLLGGTLRIDTVRLSDATVEIARTPGEESGFTISRVFAPQVPSPGGEDADEPGQRSPLPPDPPLDISLGHLQLRDVTYRQAPAPGAPPDVLVTDIDADLSGRWDGGGASVVLSLGGAAVAPLQGRLVVDVDASFAADVLRADLVRVAIGGTSLRASGTGDLRTLEGALELQGTLGPRQASFLGIPLAREARVAGAVDLSPDRVATGLELWVEQGGYVTVQGAIRPPSTRFDAVAHLVDVNPRAWTSRAPSGEVDGRVSVGGTLDPVALSVRADLERGTLAGEDVGPARVVASLGDDRVHVDEAWVAVPGAGLSVVGDASADHLDLRATLRGRDLARTASFVGALTGDPALPLAGKGVARATITGPPERPEIAYRLDAPRLRFEGIAARGVALSGAFIPGEGIPAGSARGSVDALEAGRLRARSLRLLASREEGGDFSLDARARTRVAGRELGPSSIVARGSLLPDRVDLEHLAVKYPEGSLHLRRPAAIRTGEGSIAVDDLEIEGPGRVRLSGRLERGEIAADVNVQDLRLERLPQALLPADLAGRVDVDARVRGTTTRPRGHVRFRLRRASVGDLQDLAASGTVDLGEGRAAGDVRAALGRVGVAGGSFDVPVDAAGAAATTPVELDLAIGPVKLAGLARAVGADLPTGTVRGVLRASGLIGEPDVLLRVQVEDLRPAGEEVVPPATFHVSGTLEEGLARLDAEAWSAGVRFLALEAGAPLDPRALRADPGREIDRMLASGRSRARGELRGLDLALVGRLLGMPDLQGAAAASIDMRGPIRDPRGSVQVELRGGPLGPLRSALVLADVELAEDRTQARVTFAPGEQPASHLVFTARTSLRGIAEGAAGPDTPVKLVLEVPDTRLADLLPPPPPGRPPQLAGTVSASAAFEGTLADLPGRLRVIVSDLSSGDRRLGGAELRFEQDGAASARLAAHDGGTGTIVGELDLRRALSPLRVIREGLAALRVPARARVQARDLSLAPVALSTAVRRAAGELDVDVSATGELTDLRPQGRVAITGGRVETIGGTVYDGVALQASLTGDRLTLDKLLARAPSGGELRASGRLDRRRGAPDTFTLDVRANRFPIAGEGGIVARVSADGALAGTSALDGVEGTLRLQSARVELPERPPRELQGLGRPGEFVIVSGPEAQRRRAVARTRAEEDALSVSLRVVASRVFVTGGDVQAELVTDDLTLRRTPAGEIVATGQVEARRGQVEALGRTFFVESARATFTGGEVENPRLAVTARYDTPAVKAWVDVGGTARRPEITLRSNPPLPESQIALLIATGRTTLPGQSGGIEGSPQQEDATITSTAASVAGSYAADRLRQALGPKLPLDVLTLETGGSGARLEAGAYVSDRLYLGYSRDLSNAAPQPGSAANSNEVRAEYQVSGDLSLQSRYGDRGSGGVDLVWEKSLPTPAQKEARREARREPPEDPPRPQATPGSG